MQLVQTCRLGPIKQLLEVQTAPSGRYMPAQVVVLQHEKGRLTIANSHTYVSKPGRPESF